MSKTGMFFYSLKLLFRFLSLDSVSNVSCLIIEVLPIITTCLFRQICSVRCLVFCGSIDCSNNVFTMVMLMIMFMMVMTIFRIEMVLIIIIIIIIIILIKLIVMMLRMIITKATAQNLQTFKYFMFFFYFL